MARLTPKSKGYPPLHKTRDLTHLSKDVTPQKRPTLGARHNCRPGRYTRYGAVHPLGQYTPLQGCNTPKEAHTVRATTAALDITPVTGQHTPYVALHPLGHYTPYVALHPLRGSTPLTWHYTRTERVHCLRIGCIAYVSGAAPSPTSTTADIIIRARTHLRRER